MKASAIRPESKPAAEHTAQDVLAIILAERGGRERIEKVPHHYAACVGLARGLCQIASGDKDAPTVATLVAWEQLCPPKIAPSTEPVADITRLSKNASSGVSIVVHTELTALMAEAAGVKPVKPEPVPPPGPADGECDELKREITRVKTRLNRTHAAWG